MRKIKYIVNPVAGKGEGKNSIEIIHNMMKESKIPYSITISAYEGHVEQISKESVLKGYTDIIAVGGDGTVLETFNGLYNSNVTLGVIPSGTGNDFVRSLGIVSGFEDALRKIIIGSTKIIDVGKVNDTYFLNVVGFGIDGDIVEQTQRVKKYFKGSSAYIFSTFSTLSRYKCKNIEINIDGKIFKREAYLVAVGNGKFYGGGMMITPGAEIDNEMFEIVILNKISKSKFVVLFRKVFSGKHVDEKSVEVFYGKNVKISSDDEIKINADGNILGLVPADIKILPKTQKVII